MPLTLIAPPGLSDLPDSALNAEEIAQGQHAVKILENTKFGVVRPEFFYMGRFSDGQTVARPTSAVDRLPYLASEVLYLWEIVLTADPRDGITSGPGTLLYFDYQVDQKDKPNPGLVHCKTVYHVQGGQTTETRDGELSVWAVGVRGLGQLDLAAVPAWTNVPDADFDLDSAWREDRLKDLNAAAKRSVVQAEFFDLGEFGNGQTVARPTSDVDGLLYPYADLVFLTSWRWTPAFATGLSSGPAGATLARLEKNVVGATGVVDTTVTYRLGASSDTVTQDGRVRVFAFGFRAGITATGTVSFTDLNANVFLPGKKALDDDALVMVRNSKFAALRPEFFITSQAHGSTVALPTSPIDGYAYARAELIYLYARSDTAAPGAIGSLLTLHGFVRQDTGAVTIKTSYFRQGGALTNTNNGTFRVVTVALRSKAIEVDSDPTDPGGGEPGFEGEVEGDNVNPPTDRTWLNLGYADVNDRPDRLRRVAGDLLAADIIKILEESRLDALALTNAPAEAGAEVTTGKSLTVLINRTLANIADTATRFAAAEAGANKTETRTAALIAGQGALATKSAVDLATGEVTNKTAANIAETGARKWLPTLDRIWQSQTQRDAAVDVDGNLLLKNIEKADGTTSNPTTNSSTFVDLPEMSKTFTTKGNAVLVTFSGQFQRTSGVDEVTLATVEIRVTRDGTPVGKVANQSVWKLNSRVGLSITVIDDGASAASHTYKIQWRAPNGFITRASGTDRGMQAVELG